MHILNLIQKKKQGLELSKEEIKYFISNYTNDNIPDYQASALLMAIYFNGMTDVESTNLALAMRDSGDIFDLSVIEGIKVDKHSTGGVGDKVTLILAPLLASLGAKVAKMSGRGLGHTGGTVDKLESIDGYQVELKYSDFLKQVNEIGVAVVGQSGDLAPADKKLYALRDVTATVDSMPLIASSIMSKKLASGSDVICLDVKVGNGAFMKTIEDGKKLARLMVNIGTLAGKNMTALLTSMEEPLGHKIGNGLEVFEAIETLKGNGPKDLEDVTLEIGAHLLVDAKLVESHEEALTLQKRALADGSALNKFKEMVVAQNGDVTMIDNPNLLISNQTYNIYATKSGHIQSISAKGLGDASILLGAGRLKKDDVLDLKVGIDLVKKVNDYVEKDDLIATIYYGKKGYEEAAKIINNGIVIGKDKVSKTLIYDVIKP